MLSGLISRIKERPLKDYLDAEDTKGAVLFGLLFFAATYLLQKPHLLTGLSGPNLAAAAFGLLAINVGVFVVFVSLSDSAQYQYLSRKGILNQILFQFEYTTFALLLGAVGCLLTGAFAIVTPDSTSVSLTQSIAGSLSVALFMYGFINFLHSMVEVSNYGYRRQEFNSMIEKLVDLEEHNPAELERLMKIDPLADPFADPDQHLHH